MNNLSSLVHESSRNFVNKQEQEKEEIYSL